MSSKSKQGQQHEEAEDVTSGLRGLWGVLAGLITAVLIAFPLSASIAYATHPATRRLFGGHLENASQAGFAAFWWIIALLCVALPFIVGFGVAKLSARVLSILVTIVVIFVILIVVFGQLFAF